LTTQEHLALVSIYARKGLEAVIFGLNNVMSKQETIIYVDTHTVKCQGEDNDHPLVYYAVPLEGEVVCGYCDIKFRRK